MNKETKAMAEKILGTLEGQRFADWYNDGCRFDTYITTLYPKDDPRQPTKEQILDDIAGLFHLPS